MAGNGDEKHLTGRDGPMAKDLPMEEKSVACGARGFHEEEPPGPPTQ